MADESYIRESIVLPQAKLVVGFQPIMPTFQGLISEEGLLQLVAYVKSLSKAAPSPGGISPPVTSGLDSANPLNPGPLSRRGRVQPSADKTR